MPTRPQERGRSYCRPLSPNTIPGLSVSEAGAQPSRGREATRSQGAVHSETCSGGGLSTSPPPLAAPFHMPVPCPFQHEIPVSRSAALLAPQTAHSSSSTASSHPINPSPGTKAALNSQPVSHPSSTGPPTDWFGPSAVSDSGLTSVRFSVYSEELPPYEGGPRKLSDEKRPWSDDPKRPWSDDKKRPWSDKVNASMESKGVHLKLSPGKGKQRYVMPELENLMVRKPYQGIGPSEFNPTWYFSNPLANRPRHFQFGATPTPLMNQGLNPSVPLNTAAQQYPWNPDNSSWEVITSSEGNPYSDNLMGLNQQNQYFNATGNNQNTTSLYGAQVMSGG